MSGTTNHAEAPQVSPARRSDLEDLIDLLSGAVPGCSPQTVWDLPWTWPSYRVIRGPSGRPIACGALVALDELRSEIRGLAVSEAARGRGLASTVVRALLVQAADEAREVVCVTRKPSFFAKLGFRHTPPRWLTVQRWLGAEGPPKVAMVAAEAVA